MTEGSLSPCLRLKRLRRGLGDGRGQSHIDLEEARTFTGQGQQAPRLCGGISLARSRRGQGPACVRASKGEERLRARRWPERIIDHRQVYVCV